MKSPLFSFAVLFSFSLCSMVTAQTESEPSCESESGCENESCCDDSCCHQDRGIYASFEAFFLTRNTTTDDQVIVFNANTLATELTTGDLDFGDDSGFRMIVGYEINACNALEFTYFDLNDLSAQATRVTNNNDLNLVGDLGLAALDFQNADQYTIDYTTDLRSFEMNCVRTCCGRSLLVGFRHMSLNEELNIRPDDVNTATTVYNIKTDNDLYGLHLGARLRRMGCRCGWDATVKSGIFANDATNEQFVRDFVGGFFLRHPINQAPISSSSTGVAFVNEINVNGLIRLTESCFFRAGYDIMLINGVALAPAQLDFTDTVNSGSGVSNTGTVFLHGARFGLEMRF